MHLTDAGMRGFAELSPGRAGWAYMWHGQGTLLSLADDRADLAHIGGTPWEEVEWEDGIEAPLRPTLRHSPLEWSTEVRPLPSNELMEAWSLSEELSLDALEQELVMDRVRKEEQRIEAERLLKQKDVERRALIFHRTAKARATRQRKKLREAELRKREEACAREGGHVIRALSNSCLLCKAHT